jgi:5-methylthioadenosine/S-adenosylhomocysteine deaminase
VHEPVPSHVLCAGRPEGVVTIESRCDLLLSGGSVVTVDDERRVIEPGAVAIDGDRIVAVGPADELAGWSAGRRVDCSGRAIIPGLVDCHSHLFQSLARGLGDGLALWPWLNEFMWPYAFTINAQEARVAALLGAAQAARAGTTCILDNHYAPNDLESTLSIASAIEDVGLRGVVARGIVGPPTEVARRMDLASGLFTRSAEEELEITRACLEARGGGGRVVVWPAPLNVTYVGQDLLRDAVGLAREFGVGWHTHCSEGDIDPGIYLDAYGTRPAQWLAAEGLLGDDATLAHSIWFDDVEIELIGATRTGISYNPVSNQYIGNGVARLRDLRAAGASVGLGTDGIAVTGQDLFEGMKQSVLLQRAHTGNPVESTVEEALELATREGARYARIDAGVLAPGKLADVAVVNLSNVHTRPVHRTVATLVYSARASDVEMTIVGGQVVYEGGQCRFVDEQAIVEEADARAAELVARAGMSALTSPWHRSAFGVDVERLG